MTEENTNAENLEEGPVRVYENVGTSPSEEARQNQQSSSVDMEYTVEDRGEEGMVKVYPAAGQTPSEARLGGTEEKSDAERVEAAQEAAAARVEGEEPTSGATEPDNAGDSGEDTPPAA